MAPPRRDGHLGRWDQRLALFIWWYVSVTVSIYGLCGFGVELYEWHHRVTLPEGPIVLLTWILFVGALPVVGIAFYWGWLPGTGAPRPKKPSTGEGAPGAEAPGL